MPDLFTSNSSLFSSFVFKAAIYKVISPQFGSWSKPKLSLAQLEAHRKDATEIKRENYNGFSVRLPPIPLAAPQVDAPAHVKNLSASSLPPPSDSISNPSVQPPPKPSSNVAPRRRSTSRSGLSDFFMTASLMPISSQDTFRVPDPSQRSSERRARRHSSGLTPKKSKKDYTPFAHPFLSWFLWLFVYLVFQLCPPEGANSS
ncbi:hypothetical protein DL96DRAFT_1589041 [Flagelloscypha sp. PMI_526]|nr:hypothetical protein DL96DRAFT_1589041 [Flagelloscypha sp. PMI_526]